MSAPRIEFLGEMLYQAIEHFDPGDAKPWPELSSRERDFYVQVITRVLQLGKEQVLEFLAD